MLEINCKESTFHCNRFVAAFLYSNIMMFNIQSYDLVEHKSSLLL